MNRPMPKPIHITLLILTVLMSACKFGSTDYSNINGGGTGSGTGFTWISGSDMAEQTGVYGTQGTADATNTPGARQYAVSWTDSNGNLWLFGGYGLDASGTTSGYLNDLWQFDGSHWTWIGGGNSINQPGTYGTKGAANTANIPGARSRAVGWVDANGNLWLFGGYGLDASSSVTGPLNDLWKFDGSNWTWVAGSNAINQSGTYGTQGTANVANIPGARSRATAWTDSSGAYLWLFGGTGKDASGTTGYLNDFWRFDIANNTWTWSAGSDTVDQNGSYSAPAMPGGREGATGWIDANGYLWLFGGYGLDRYGTTGSLNDLWQYTTAWTWTGKGDQAANVAGKYSLPLFAPGARDGATGWTDSDGNLWLFGGLGYDVAGDQGHLNDIWMFDRIGSSGWNWISGANTVDQSGVYGTQGVAATTNHPGGREGADSWISTDGTAWLFGGNGIDGYGTRGNLNDLWRYSP